MKERQPAEGLKPLALFEQRPPDGSFLPEWVQELIAAASQP
jgi:hypothetical protein